MHWRRSAVVVMASAIVLSACGSDANEDLQGEVVANYAAVVHESYAMSLASATEMDAAIDALAADPTAANLDAARAAWLAARNDYGPTEAFRFYGGPIDAEETGVEGLVNAWPLDEAYIDYVEGAPESGLVNLPDDYPTIDAELLVSLNEVGGETNISTGWHAIEFLLWGQDLADDGPGERDRSTTSRRPQRRPSARLSDRRLGSPHRALCSLSSTPGHPMSRTTTEPSSLPCRPKRPSGMILTGIGELSRGELAGERLTVAYEEHSQEDEHSCFSDNTTSDIVANAAGISGSISADVGHVDGPGIDALVRATDADLATRLEEEIAASVAAAESIPAPFDKSLAPGVPDDDPGRVAIFDTIVALELQAETLVEAADRMGLQLNLS